MFFIYSIFYMSKMDQWSGFEHFCLFSCTPSAQYSAGSLVSHWHSFQDCLSNLFVNY